MRQELCRCGHGRHWHYEYHDVVGGCTNADSGPCCPCEAYTPTPAPEGETHCKHCHGEGHIGCQCLDDDDATPPAPDAVERFPGLLTREALLDYIQSTDNPDAIRARLERAFEKVQADAVERVVRAVAPLFVDEFKGHWVRTGTAMRAEDAGLLAEQVIARALAARNPQETP